MTLLSLMGGWLLFKGGDLIASYKNSKAIHHFLEEIYHTKMLALSYRSSMVLKLTPSPEGVTIERLCYTHPDYNKLGLNQKIEISHLEMKPREIQVNSLGEFCDEQWAVFTKTDSYQVKIEKNQISAKRTSLREKEEQQVME